MGSERKASVETATGLGWARRVVRQQLDALSRLAAAAWRLVDPAAAVAAPLPTTTVSAGILGLEKALRLQARVAWALRLIDALRAKLLGDLQSLENGQTPAPSVEARSFAAEPERSTANEARHAPEKAERAERAERPERLEREHFGFQGRGVGDDLAEILKRPTVEVIALICRELGLPEDWPRLAEEAWAREEVDGALVLRQAQDEGGIFGRSPRRTSPPSTTPKLSSS